MIMKMNNKLLLPIFLLSVSSCAISPGMNMEIHKKNEKEFVFLDNKKEQKIEVTEINLDYIKNNESSFDPYRIGIGDGLSITVWGLPEVFPMVNLGQDQSLRRVNSDGTIFFPYAGTLIAAGKTQVDLRKELTDRLSVFFKDPQLDVNIASFESQKIYLLGEVTRPMKVNIKETPLSLSDALGEVQGLSTTTSDASDVYVIRQINENMEPKIFRADMSSPSAFLIASEFYLMSGDIVYVNANGTTQWNRVISQFFPFSSFINSIDNLIED